MGTGEFSGSESVNGRKVLALQVRKFRENFILGHSAGEGLEHILYEPVSSR